MTISRHSRACHHSLGCLPSKLGLKARQPGYCLNIDDSVGFFNLVEAKPAQNSMPDAFEVIRS